MTLHAQPLKHLLFTSLLVASGATFANTSDKATESLYDVFKLAKANDTQYQADLAANNAFRQLHGIRKAAIRPNVSAYYNYQQQDTDEETIIGATGANGEPVFNAVGYAQENTSNNWGITLSQSLYNAKANAEAKQGRLEAKSAGIRDNIAEQNLVLRTTDAYFAVLRADNALRVAVAQYEADEWLLRQTKGRYDVGAVAYTDVHQAQAAFDISKAQQLAAELDVENQRNVLSILTNQSHQQLAPVARFFRPSSAQKTAQYWSSNASTQALNVKLALLEADISKAAAKAIKRSRRPSVTANISYIDNSTDSTIASLPTNTIASNGTQFGISVQAPLYLGGGISAQKRQANAEYQRANSLASFQRRTAEQQAINAYNRLNVANSQYHAQRQALKSAKSAANAVEAGYEAGLNTIVDLVSAKRSYFAAQKDFENAKLDYLQNFLALEASAGQLDAADLDYVNQQLDRQ